MDPLTTELLALPRLGDGVGLHRAEALVAGLELGDWWDQACAIKVTGSNGKGSTVAFIEAIGEALGFCTGAFVSPHLQQLGERFRIRGIPVDDDRLHRVGGTVRAQVTAWQQTHPDDGLGVFEALFALGVAIHADAGVQLPVYEAGIGGRFDPTRLLAGPVSVLTNVDLEHTALLGPTRFHIATDKADIATGGLLVVGPMDPPLRARLEVYCRLAGVRPVFVEDDVTIHAVRHVDGGLLADLTVGGLVLDELTVALHGRHQLDNLCCAVLAVQHWLQCTGRSLVGLSGAVREAAATVRHPCRFERIAEDPPVWVDGAYTPAGVAALVGLVQARGRPVALVLGASLGRDLAALAAGLVPMAQHIVCTRARHRGAPVAAVAAAVGTVLTAGQTVAEAPLVEALVQARAWASAHDGEVVVAGGLFLAAEAAQRLQGTWSEDIVLL